MKNESFPLSGKSVIFPLVPPPDASLKQYIAKVKDWGAGTAQTNQTPPEEEGAVTCEKGGCVSELIIPREVELFSKFNVNRKLFMESKIAESKYLKT